MILKLKRVIKNPYVFSIVTKVIVVLVGFLFTVFQSRYLGPTLKGRVSYVLSVTNITAILFCFGIHQAYPYFKRRTTEDIRPVFLRIAIAFLLSYGVFAFILATMFLHDERLIAVAFITPLLVYNRVISYLIMVDNPNRKNSVELAANFVELSAVIILYLFLEAEFWLGIALILLKDLLMAVVYTWELRKIFFAPYHITYRKVLAIFKFGFYPMLALLMSTLNYRIDIIMLGNLVSDAEVGIYSIGVMIAERIWLIPDAMKEVMVSNLVKGKDENEVAYVIRICNSSCAALILFIVALGKPLINFIFGEQYDGAYGVMVLILLGVVAMVYYKVIASYNIVQARQLTNFMFLGVSVVANVPMNLLLIPKFGINGAAIASVGAYCLCAILFVGDFLKNTNIKLKDILFINHNDIGHLKKKIIEKKGV